MTAGPALALTLPTDGGASTRRTLARFLKKMARESLALSPALVGGHHAPALSALQAELRRFAGQRDRGPLYHVLRRPHVHVLLTTSYRAAADGDAAAAAIRARAFVFQTLLELSLDGQLRARVVWPGPAPGGVLASPTRRLHRTVGEDATIAFGPEGVTVDDAPLALEPSDRFLPVAPGVMLTLEDNNPISDFEAHPDKDGNQLDLGDADAGAWVDSLQRSLAVVAKHLPSLREEMSLLLQQLVPVGTDDDKHLSASYREAIGAVYLTLHPRVMTMAEAVVHEYQHNKINALFHLDPVMHNAYWPLYDSPVRPDPRPLHGVLLAAHAFVPVAELYARMFEGDEGARQGGLYERYRQIVGKNEAALSVLLEHADCTPAGRVVLDDLAAIHARHT